MSDDLDAVIEQEIAGKQSRPDPAWEAALIRGAPLSRLMAPPPKPSVLKRTAPRMPEKKHKPQTRKHDIDVHGKVLRVKTPTDSYEFSLVGFPPHVEMYLIGRAVRDLLSRHKDPFAGYGALREGRLPEKGGVYVRGPSDKAMAIMAAVADDIRAREPDLAEEVVRAKAEQFVKEIPGGMRAEIAKHPAVLEYLARLKRPNTQVGVMDMALRLKTNG